MRPEPRAASCLFLPWQVGGSPDVTQGRVPSTMQLPRLLRSHQRPYFPRGWDLGLIRLGSNRLKRCQTFHVPVARPRRVPTPGWLHSSTPTLVSFSAPPHRGLCNAAEAGVGAEPGVQDWVDSRAAPAHHPQLPGQLMTGFLLQGDGGQGPCHSGLDGFCRYFLSWKVKQPRRGRATSLAQLAMGHWALALKHPLVSEDLSHVPFLVSSELSTERVQISSLSPHRLRTSAGPQSCRAGCWVDGQAWAEGPWRLHRSHPV